MDLNSNPAHRGSAQVYPYELYDSTPYGGGTDRSAYINHLEYQNYPSQPEYNQGLVLQRTSNSLRYDWQAQLALSQQYHQPQETAANSFDPVELRTFSRPANEGPWSGQDIGGVPGTRLQQNPQLTPRSTYTYKAHTVAAGPLSTDFLQPPLPSGRTSHPESQDSGFHSQNTNAHDLSKHLSNVCEFKSGRRPALAINAPRQAKSVKSESRVQTTQESNRQRKVKAPVTPCPKCKKELKNHSDARKHEQTHTKPFTCDVQECSRREGFATVNDLQRHKKSVHDAKPSVGNENGFICQECLPTPGSQPKWWPRQDNFKAHIKRKHTEWNTEGLIKELIKKSEAPRPADAVSESGYGTQRAPSVVTQEPVYEQDLIGPMEMSMSRQESRQGDLNFFSLDQGHFDPLVGVGEGPLVGNYGAARESNTRIHESYPGSFSNGLSVLQDAALQLPSPVDSIMTSPATYRVSVPSVHINNFAFNHQTPPFRPERWGEPPPKRQKLDWPPKEPSVDLQDSINANRTNNGEYGCPHCEKVKKRECDLRKHIKRHTRPYGCTFPNCHKPFGSRNDWKRHENSQHCLQEMWRCELKDVNGNPCCKVICHEETFVNHIQRKHGLDGKSSEVQDYCKRMHLGREAHDHFWCGFCNCLVPQEGGMQQDGMQEEGMQKSAWVMRLKHIGDHIDKDNYHIKDWICIEHNKKKGEITEDDRKKVKTRLRSGKSDSESDLGDNRISWSISLKSTTNMSKADYEEVDADGVSD